MNEAVLRIRDMFVELVPGFGIAHAKVYKALVCGEIKTARQLSRETGISNNQIYSILNSLIKEKLALCSNTEPKNYHLQAPEKTYERLVNRKIALLEKKAESFEKIINDGNEESGKEYLIKFDEKQTKLIDNKNKAVVKEIYEAKQIIKQLTIYIAKLEPKKEYNIAVYR